MGRPSKGQRIRLTTRVTPAVHAAAVKQAARNNVTVSEWLDQVVREKVTT